MLTNCPQKFTATGIFPNDVSDHFVIGCVRDTKIPKRCPRFVIRRNYKQFCEQAFLRDLSECDLDLVSLVPDIEL